jgi:hypothetical protein
MLWRWSRGRYTKRMEEDDKKIAGFLNQFNKGKKGPWIAANGFNIWLNFAFGNASQSNTIKADEGVVVKVFINSNTGEIKSVLAQAVLKDGQ